MAGESICIACREPAPHHVKTADKQIRRVEVIDGETRRPLIMLPTVDLCEAHFKAMVDDKFYFGWCDDELCRRWGTSGDRSPYGEPYRELRYR